MIKITIALACLIYSGRAFSQFDNGTLTLRSSAGRWGIDPISPGHKCGTWEPQKPDTSDWFTVDTLGKKVHFTDARDWKYSEEAQEYEGTVITIYAPCGLGEPVIYDQYRVCSLTGIRQKRQRIISFKYIEAPRSEYEKVTDSLYATVIPKMDTVLLNGNYLLLGGIDSTISSVSRTDTLTFVKPKKKKKR